MIIRDGKNVILSAKPENVIVAELKNGAACKNYRNCISGTFQYQNKANAILISNGRVISNLSAHGWIGFPDSVILEFPSLFGTVRTVKSPCLLNMIGFP